MNKKWIAVIALAVVILLVLAFCGLNQGDEPVDPTTGPTEPTAQTEETTEPTEPAPTEPEWEPGILRAAYAEGIFDTLIVGTEVEVVGQFKDYYVIAGEEYDLLVEKRFIRLDSEETFESWTAYARNGAEVFDSVYMREDPAATLKTNTDLTVLEGKGNWLYVEWADGKGYMNAECISKTRIGGGAKPDSGSSGGNGGTTEQPKDGTDVDIGSLSHNQVQGGVVLLGAYYGPEQEPDFTPGKGIVIAEAVEAYLVLGKRDDEVKVTEAGDDYCTVWLEEELYVKLPRWLVRLEGDEEYEFWNGYAKSSAIVYEEYQLRNEVKKLNRNTEVTVLDEIPEKLYSYYHPGCYVVEIDGEVYYMTLDSVSKTKYTAPSNNDGGNGGGGNNSGGGGSTGDTWTPPAL